MGRRSVSDWIFRRGGRNRLINWLDLDSQIDSSLFETWQDLKDRWTAASTFFARFRLTGIRKWLNELVSEGFNLGLGGLLVMLTLAQPAFEAVQRDDWLATGQYSVTFLDRYGNEIGKRGILHSDAVPLEEIPDHLIKATLATEDRRFFEHFGIDVVGTLRALIENVRARAVVQGGSSITQQLAKNLFLTSEQSLERKVKEAFLALWLEGHLSKKQILKLYLDRAYMGGGAFGVEAASQFYFGKSVRDINLAEAAMLSGLYKAPTKYAPHANLPAARARANEVLTNMVEAGFMTEGQVHAARLNPAKVVEQTNPDSPDYYLDWAFEEVRRLLKGKNDYVVTARTTIDLRLQRAAKEAVLSTLQRYSRLRAVKQAALVSMETDGAVVAMVGGRDYGESQFNRATAARRQPGSSFKPYVYLAAIQKRDYKTNSIVVDSPVFCGRGHAIRNYDGRYRGRMPMWSALSRSINTVAVKLSREAGRNNVISLAHKLGLRRVVKSCTMALGDTGLTVLEHTGGYAHFANGGRSVRPYAIVEIRNTKGEAIYLRERDEPPARQIVPRKYVERLNFMLGQVVIPGVGTARRAHLEFTTAAGKTGTTSSYRDAWFMGFTGKYVTGVWYGNDNFRPTGRVTGGSLPAETWKLYMTAAHNSPNIPPIPGLPLHPNQVAEMARLAALKASGPTTAAPTAADAIAKMPDRTRDALRRLSQIMREAAGLGPAPGASKGGKGAKSGKPKTGREASARKVTPKRL